VGRRIIKYSNLIASDMIALTPDQKARMKKLGEMGDTYSTVLEKLLRF